MLRRHVKGRRSGRIARARLRPVCQAMVDDHQISALEEPCHIPVLAGNYCQPLVEFRPLERGIPLGVIPRRFAGFGCHRRIGAGIQQRLQDDRRGRAIHRRRMQGRRSRFVPYAHSCSSFHKGGNNGGSAPVPRRKVEGSRPRLIPCVRFGSGLQAMGDSPGVNVLEEHSRVPIVLTGELHHLPMQILEDGILRKVVPRSPPGFVLGLPVGAGREQGFDNRAGLSEPRREMQRSPSAPPVPRIDLGARRCKCRHERGRATLSRVVHARASVPVPFHPVTARPKVESPRESCPIHSMQAQRPNTPIARDLSATAPFKSESGDTSSKPRRSAAFTAREPRR